MTQRQAILNIVFISIQNRYNSLFFSKIFQYISQQDQDNTDHVRHYDKQCEAVQIINDTLSTLIQKVKCKAFYALKLQSRQKKRIITKVNKSIGAPQTPKNKNKYSKQLSTNTRLNNNHLNRSHMQITQLSNQVQTSISKLLGRVQRLTERINDKQIQPSQTKHDSGQKKKLIMSRLTQLQHSVQQFNQSKIQYTYDPSNSAIIFRNQNNFRSKDRVGSKSVIHNSPQTTI